MSESGWKTYRPSNGSMGEEFLRVVCTGCVKNRGDCDILDRSFWRDIEDPYYPTEMQIKWIDKPERHYDIRCTAREAKVNDD